MERQVLIMSNADSRKPIDERNVGPPLDEADDETLNQAFDLLRDQRRRYVLEILYTAPETVMSTDDLADHVLERDPDAVERDRVLVSLHHDILPRFADTSIIDFDARTDTVRYRGSELVDALLTVLAD